MNKDFLEEPTPPIYKPLPKSHKFLKPNAQGQVPLKCVNFNNFGKHCCRILNPDAKSIDDVKIEEKDCIFKVISPA